MDYADGNSNWQHYNPPNDAAQKNVCKCGFPLKQAQTRKNGPNFGKWYVTCQKGKITEGGCGYFRFIAGPSNNPGSTTTGTQFIASSDSGIYAASYPLSNIPKFQFQQGGGAGKNNNSTTTTTYNDNNGYYFGGPIKSVRRREMEDGNSFGEGSEENRTFNPFENVPAAKRSRQEFPHLHEIRDPVTQPNFGVQPPHSTSTILSGADDGRDDGSSVEIETGSESFDKRDQKNSNPCKDPQIQRYREITMRCIFNHLNKDFSDKQKFYEILEKVNTNILLLGEKLDKTIQEMKTLMERVEKILSENNKEKNNN
jgi:hypothetical protein